MMTKCVMMIHIDDRDTDCPKQVMGATPERLIRDIYMEIIIPLHETMLRYAGEGVAVGCHELYIPLKPYLRICDFFNKSYNEQVDADNFIACAKLFDLIRYAMKHKERDLDYILEGIGVTTMVYERWMKEIVA